MLRIALCDDETGLRERLSGLVRDYLDRRPALTARLSAFPSGPALLGAAAGRSGAGEDPLG